MEKRGFAADATNEIDQAILKGNQSVFINNLVLESNQLQLNQMEGNLKT